MNKPIYVNTNSDGLGTPENPYQYPSAVFESHETYLVRIGKENQWDKEHPDFLPTYSQNNELIVNSRVEVIEVWQYMPSFSTDWQDIIFHDKYTKDQQVSIFNTTRRIYRQVAIKEEKATTEESSGVEEKELYYCLSDNADLNGLYLSSMREVSEHIEMDLGDIQPSDRENVQYTITPVYLTQTEFSNLPEYEG